MRGHQRSDTLLQDYCDGSDFHSHQLFRTNHRALQINLFYDDAEVCNPLGSKAKVHKLGKLLLFDVSCITFIRFLLLHYW